MDILFCSDLSVKEELFISAFLDIEKQGGIPTWDSLMDKLQVSSITIRRYGKLLEDKGILGINLRFSKKKGQLPTELVLNKEELKKHIIRHQ